MKSSRRSTNNPSDEDERGSAIATGDKGTIIQCEYITSAWNGGGSGACKDNHDVLYKLMFLKGAIFGHLVGNFVEQAFSICA
jgi:hypothetical protein